MCNHVSSLCELLVTIRTDEQLTIARHYLSVTTTMLDDDQRYDQKFQLYRNIPYFIYNSSVSNCDVASVASYLRMSNNSTVINVLSQGCVSCIQEIVQLWNLQHKKKSYISV